MEKLIPTLLVNYSRPIGRKWLREVISGEDSSSNFNLGHIIEVKELIVPSVPGETGINLAALGNAIYTAAREANMSLSGYGHLDPIKFVFATAMLALLYEEVKRDIRTYNSYQFGNRTCGRLLINATTKLTEEELLNNIPTILLKMDTLANRINNLYIPAIVMFKDVLPHRSYIYKDDEGERYQLYFYKMANYYELIVDPNSPMVGQLKCRWINKATTLLQRISLIEQLLTKYEGDDDFVNFATEAVKAGLPRLQVNKLSRTVQDGAITIEPMEFQFNIDDICSLENANTVNPVVDVDPNSAKRFQDMHTSWDIYEDPNKGVFQVGKMGSISTTNRVYDMLPVVNPFSLSSKMLTEMTRNGRVMSIDNRPIFSRAKVTSEEGIYHLVKYVVGFGTPVSPTSIGATPASKIEYVSDTNALSLSESENELLCVSPLSCHGSCLVHSISYWYVTAEDAIHSEFIKLFGNLIAFKADDQLSNTSIYQFLKCFRGYKFAPYVYIIGFGSTGNYHPSEFLPLFKDFDYVTTISEESLNIYHSTYLWNGFIMLSMSSGKSRFSGGSNKSKKHKKSKGSKDKETGDKQPDDSSGK